MSLVDLLQDLQRLERSAATLHGQLILEAFTRHTAFDEGAVYLRDGRDSALRLAASSERYVAPEILEVPAEEIFLAPRPHVVFPLRNTKEHFGAVLMAGEQPSEDALQIARAGALFVTALMTNHRLAGEMREGDFQLKYRLWELESLYDIGLSIAATLNIDELADEILFRMISLTNARRAALFLREGPDFVLFRSFGDVSSELLERGLAQRLVEAGAPLSYDGDGSDCLFPDCTAFVAVPIKGNNEVIGVLAAADRETREGGIGAFEENELRLLSLFASQVAIAIENAKLHKQALEKQAMDREFELAATIQRDILPKTVPSLPGYEIAALSHPARQVGGDYHAFFEREGVLTLLVADVAGKSMPAALLVSALHAAVQLLFAEGRELGEIATELNKHIHRWSAENKFITMIMVAIDRENEMLQFVNAGHNPCYVALNGRLELLRSHGLPIGILGQTIYMTQTRPFPTGSSVVLYSDGITEAENEAGDEFDNPRLEAILRESLTAAPDVLRDQIAAAVETFVGSAPQKDDQTLVVVRTA